MDQQGRPAELDLGYGDDETDLGYEPSPQQEQLEPTGAVRGVHFDTASSQGDNSYSSDWSSYESTTSWEEGRVSDFTAASSKKPKKKKVAARQQKRVSQARIFVLVLLAMTSVGISLIVYFVTRDKEEEDYKHHFDVLAARIFEAVKDNIHTTFTAMNTVSNSITTRVMDGMQGEEWPLVTLNSFERISGEVRNITGAVQVIFAPLVNETMRLSWEMYSVEHQGWAYPPDEVRDRRNLLLDESLWYPPLSKQQPTQLNQLQYYRRQLEGDEFRGAIPSQIHPPLSAEERDANPEQVLYAPIWQMSPIPSQLDLINLDLFREPSFQNLAGMMLETRQAVLSKHIHDNLTDILYFKYNNANQNQTTVMPPTSLLIQPVWKTYDGPEGDSDLAGYLLAWIPWSAFFKHSFREVREEEVLTRLESSCQPQYTLSYANGGGKDVQYLDDEQGVLSHDESMERSMIFATQLSDLMVESAIDEVVGPPKARRRRRLQEGQVYQNNVSPDCQVQVHMYATDELYELYITSSPGLYLMGVIITFAVLAIAFLIYDHLVERRQFRVMDMAENTGRILSNLFPTQFADKLLAEKKEKEKEAKRERKREERKNRKRKKKKKKHKNEFELEQAPDKQLKKFMDGDKKDGGTAETMDAGEDADDADESPLFLAKSKPIADLFPDTTVLFSDIAGFTAWSSVREPSQVFVLLESIYQAFDFLAKQYGIFKIETIGDCYVAVCGLPDPREDHAVAMSRFSLAAMVKMKNLVNQLEVSLGPDTGELTMRFGLHSGPVTAGVLRGERARFQLFGDTVNTAARMESTGERDKIQISQQTRDKLVEAGKVHWFVKREDVVKAKGKGDLQTYWLVSSQGNVRRMSMLGAERRMTMGAGFGGGGRRASMGRGRRMSMAAPTRIDQHPTDPKNPPQLLNVPNGSNNYFSADSVESDGSSSSSQRSFQEETPKLTMPTDLSKKQLRLIDWNCELLQQLLRQIVAQRNSSKGAPKRMPLPGVSMLDLPKLGRLTIMKLNDTKLADPIPLDEFAEAIDLPEFDVAAYHASMDARSITLDPAVVAQLRTYVAILASKYRSNEFHNFEHASHVAMSVSKFLTKVVAPDIPSIDGRPETDNDDSDSDISYSDSDSDGDHAAERSKMRTLHDHTYGITSDPLTGFSVVMSALIHDVDHKGVPNAVLIQEEPEMAAKYQARSVAEQHSIDLAWELLMHHTFTLLRETICGTAAELKRFRQLVVQSVLATDLFDPGMSTMRKARWEKAFSEGENNEIGIPNASGHKRPSFMNFRTNDARYETNRKATLVIEHIMQASDVAHTMQHWHIYQKWNTQLFTEMYTAYKKGRCDKDPSEDFYQGELSFFDNYIIPLAKKLKECGVFGASSDEYLNYATANRKEWEIKGESIVASMVDKCSKDAS